MEVIVLEVIEVLEVLVLEVLEVLVLEVLKVSEVLVLEVLPYSTPSKDCVHCEIPPILCGDLTFVLELCDWAVTSTLLLLVLFTFWKVSLKNTKYIYCDSNWGCVRNTCSAYNPQHINTQIKVFLWDCGFSGNCFFFHCTIQV